MKFLEYTAIAIFVSTLLSACTSVSSRNASTAPRSNNGIVYSLPKRLIDVKVEFSEDGNHTLAVSGGSYYPDSRAEYRFIARIHSGKVGSNNSKLSAPGGLLSNADAAYTGQAAELGKAVGSLAGTLGTIGKSGAFGTGWANLGMLPASSCNRKTSASRSIPFSEFIDGKYTYNPLPNTPACSSVVVIIKRLGDTKDYTPIEPQSKGERSNGLWHRIELPYLVTATVGDNLSTSTLIMLPDESPKYFAEMGSGLFADSTSKMTFSNGVLTGTDRDNDSEVIALLKIPASLISAYTSAIGDVFSNFSTGKKQEANSEIARLNRDLVIRQLDACRAAIAQSQSEDAIKQLCTIPPLQ